MEKYANAELQNDFCSFRHVIWLLTPSLSFLHLYVFSYFLAFKFVNVKHTSFYIPVLLFHLRFNVVAFIPPSWIFKKIHNFSGRSAVWGQYASRYRISAKSVKRSQTYGDLTDSQNGGRPPSWICEIQTI